MRMIPVVVFAHDARGVLAWFDGDRLVDDAALVGVVGMNSATLVWFGAAALGLGALLLKISRQTSQIATIIATLISAASLWPLRTRIQSTLDQRFFRSRSNLAVAMQ